MEGKRAVINEAKAALRQQVRMAKQQYAAQLPSMSAAIVEQLKKRLEGYRTIMAYWPLPDEVDIRPLLEKLLKKGTVILLPKVLDDNTMELRRYTSQADLAEGAFHIMEPIGEPFTDYGQIEIALIPGMAFDAAGHRLGRGKGYYDRFLSTIYHSPLTTHQHPKLIGLCFPFQRVAEVPSEEHDVIMDEVI